MNSNDELFSNSKNKIPLDYTHFDKKIYSCETQFNFKQRNVKI